MKLIIATTAAALVACGGTPRPTADPGMAERTGRAGEELTFDGSASRGSITKYTWDFGDQSATEEGQVVKHTYATNGNYTATLTVRGPGGAHSASVLVNVGAGCAATAMVQVITSDPQPNMPVLFSTSGSSGCMGEPLTNYEWDFGDTAMDMGANKATVQHTYSAMGMYTVRLKVTDMKGNTGQATRLLGVGVMVTCGKPTITCPASLNGEMGKPIAFSANGSDAPCGMAMTYAWTFSDGTTAMGSSVMHTFANAMSYTANVTATTSDARSSDPCSVNVTVTAPRNYTGSWLISPSGGNFSGACSSVFTTGFPATTLGILHQGNMLTVSPSGGPYPGSPALTGTEDPPPAPSGTFTVRATTPQENPGGMTCNLNLNTAHTVHLTFTAANVVTGYWTKVYDGCTVFACANCNCVAGGMTAGAFSGIKP